MIEYAVQAGITDPTGLAAALNAMAANGFELTFLYDTSLDEPPLLVYSRELDPDAAAWSPE